MTLVLSDPTEDPSEDSSIQRIAVIGSGTRMIEIATALSRLDGFNVTVASLSSLEAGTLTVARTVGQAVGPADATVIVSDTPEDLHALLLGRGAAAVSGQQNALFLDLSDVPAEVTSICARRVSTLRKRYVNLVRTNAGDLAGQDRFEDAKPILAALSELSYAGA